MENTILRKISAIFFAQNCGNFAQYGKGRFAQNFRNFFYSKLRNISAVLNKKNNFRSNTPISKDIFVNAQNRLDLSNNAVLDLAASFRTDGVEIESGLREDLYESGTFLKDHFDVKDFDLEVKQADGSTQMQSKPVVFCKDVDTFVKFVKEKRGTKNPVILRYGADGGGK